MMSLANAVPPQPFSWVVLLALLMMLLLSAAMFAVLVRRWTSQRGRAVLSDWCKGKGFALIDPERADAGALVGAARVPLRVRLWLRGRETSLAILEAEPGEAAQGTTGSDALPRQWHVLVRQVRANWPMTGLRPTRAGESLLDLYSLSSYPAMGNIERFIVFGTDTLAARRVSKSHARGLLPPDIGMLVDDGKLILDFSQRPFDPMEFDRMLALADQLARQLATR